jgi:hypothetical protein
MDEQFFETVLDALLNEVAGMDADDRDEAGITIGGHLERARIRTFEEAGILSLNRGLVVHLPDGAEFQVTLVQSAGSNA